MVNSVVSSVGSLLVRENERESGLAATTRERARCCGRSSGGTGSKRSSETESVEERFLGAGKGLQGGKANEKEGDDEGGVVEQGACDPRPMPG